MDKNKLMKLHLNSAYGRMVERNIGEHTQYKKRRFSKFFKWCFEWLLTFNFVFTWSDEKFVKRNEYLTYVFYPKWVLGECRHLCRKCEYKHECFSNIESEE